MITSIETVKEIQGKLATIFLESEIQQRLVEDEMANAALDIFFWLKDRGYDILERLPNPKLGDVI